MRKFLSQGILFAVVVAVGVAATGCSQYNGLKAKRTFRDANGLYQGSDYKAAAAKYEQVVFCTDERSGLHATEDLDGRLGVNAAFLVGHCALRRYVMGADAIGHGPTGGVAGWPHISG